MSFRKRRRDDLDSLVNNARYSDDENENVEEIQFQNGETPFVLRQPFKSYTHGKIDFDKNLIGSNLHWHKIIICHGKKFSFSAVLPELYRIVGDEFFVPIAFRSSNFIDTFFVHDQGRALVKLFKADLRIFVDERPVDLMVNFGVADFKEGMFTPHHSLTRAIARSVKPTTPQTMSLANIADNADLSDMIFSLSNTKCLQLFCSLVMKSSSFLHKIHTLDLSGNEISKLQPLRALNSKILKVLNLQSNKIESIDEFSNLNHLQLDELLINNNPVTEIQFFADQIKNVLQSVKKFDEENWKNSSIPTVSITNKSEEIKIFNENVIVIRFGDVGNHDISIFNNDSWNKVLLEHNDKVSKEKILNEMNRQFFDDVPFFPCYYKQKKKFDSFYLYKNPEALRILVENNLMMEIPSLNCEVKFEIHLKCAEWVDGHMNWQEKLKNVLRKRIRDSKLNLENFANDPDLKSLSISLSLGNKFILNTAFKINYGITSINLSGNKISALNFNFSQFPRLDSLYLSNNCISTFGTFQKLPNIVEVSLDKNPICLKFYEKPRRYVQYLLKIFPNLQIVDGRKIDKSSKTVFMRNFLFRQESFTLTESFIKFYFDLYDSNLRNSLRKFYDDNSLFTTSDSCDKNSRNLLDDENYTEKIFVGREKITRYFESLPKTTHDFSTFCVDVPLTTERNVLITVNGCFKIMSDSMNVDDNIRGFARTFFLERKNEKKGTLRNTFKYQITNETLMILGISDEMKRVAFKKSVVTEAEVKKLCQDLLPSQAEEEEGKILLLKDMTHLKKNWCKRLLEDANWNMLEALGYFNEFVDREIFCLDDFEVKEVEKETI